MCIFFGYLDCMTLLGNVHILCIIPLEITLIGKKSLRTIYSNLTYCSSYILTVKTTMVWYVVFRGQKPGVYESWIICIEYVVVFSGATFQSYSTRMQAEEAYQAFLEHVTEKGEHVSNKWCF
jgi:hypothetical protein